MRKIIACVFIICLSKHVFAQTNTFPTSGNVGIGTLSPTTKLHIALTTNTSAVSTQANLGGYIHLSDFASDLDSKTAIVASFQSNPGIASGVIFGRYSNQWGTYVAFHTHANNTVTLDDLTEKMRIDGDGNVGIGTASPTAKLNVVLTGTTTAKTSLSSFGSTGMIYLDGLAGTTNSEIGLFGGSGYNSLSAGIGIVREDVANWATQLRFYTHISSTGGAAADILEKMRITGDGNVGIGTTSPSEKLSVNGNISTKKLIVTQSGWSDYVFNKNYKLRTLQQVETFIKENNHLPEIPSAKEVEEKGISVGDNQALLLKKIEELTLYVIDLQKEINALKLKIKRK